MKHLVHGFIVAVTIGLAGCTPLLIADPPGPNVPEISRLEIAPVRVTARCPVTLRFHVENVDASSARAVVVWELDRYRVEGSASEVKPLDRAPAFEPLRGDVAVTVTPPIWGRYRYSLQVRDAAGQRSNVLTGVVLADLPYLFVPSTCS